MSSVGTVAVDIRTNTAKFVEGINRANAKLDAFDKTVGKAGAALRIFTGIFAANQFTSKLIDTARQTDILSASLITATGSTEKATEQFKKLEDFASKTPFLLEQSVNAYVKLVNLGLTPSERAMMSYGNTAAAMGKDLTQMIEAVADATTGEFERLKEFGIKSKSEGDNVSFTFRGITTTIKKNAAEIEKYLINLGENNFGSAMADRMGTLDGALSNLQDSWDQTFRVIAGSDIGKSIENQVRNASNWLGEFNKALKFTLNNGFFGSEIDDLYKQRNALLKEMVEVQTLFGENDSRRMKALDNQYNAIQDKIDVLEEKLGLVKKQAAIVIPVTDGQTAQTFNINDIGTPVFDESILADSFEARIDYLNEHNLMVREVIQEHNRLVEQDERESLARRKMMNEQLAANIGSIFTNLSGVLASQSRKAFKVHQGFAILESTINSYQAFTKALAQGGIYGYVAAGAVLAAGMAKVHAIASMSPGGGRGSVAYSSPAGSVGVTSPTVDPLDAARATANSEQTSEIHINLNIDGKTAEEIVVTGLPAAISKDRIVIKDADGSTYRDFRFF